MNEREKDAFPGAQKKPFLVRYLLLFQSGGKWTDLDATLSSWEAFQTTANY